MGFRLLKICWPQSRWVNPRRLNSRWSALLLVAATGCASSDPGGDARGPAAGIGAAKTMTVPEQLAGWDLVHVDVLQARPESQGYQVRMVAVPEAGVDEGGQPEAAPAEWQGRPLQVRFYYDGASRAANRPVTVEVDGVGAAGGSGSAGLGDVADFLGSFAASDRATLWVEHAGPERDLRWGAAPLAQHARALRDLRDDLTASEAIPAGAPFATEEVRAPEAEALEEFMAFCEVELLVRRPLGIDAGLTLDPGGRSAALRAPAEEWFGGLVAAKPGRSGAAIRGLAAELHRAFVDSKELAQPDGEAEAGALVGYERLHVQSAEDEWAVPRVIAMGAVVDALHGEGTFRRIRRELVNRYRGGDAIGWEELAEVAEAEAPDIGGRYVRAWLQSPAEPKVKTRWTYDEARGRVLLRVDQIHELRGTGVPPAYPFRLDVVVEYPGAEPTEVTLDVSKRRDLLEVPVGGEPSGVTLDPKGRLTDVLTLEISEGPGRSTEAEALKR